MKRNLVDLKPLKSSFLSHEKDVETILRKLFIENQPYSDTLKRLLVVNTKDCLTNTQSNVYNEKIKEMSLHKLVEEGYVKLSPKIRMAEHEEVKTYLVISFDNYMPNEENPYFRDCIVNFDIICMTDWWDMDNYQIRPLKIAGYIDGLLNNTHLSGIGTFNFVGCNELLLDENLSGYTLMYRAVHGHDDMLPPEGE